MVPVPATGDIVGGKYRVEGVLATGGMGIVLSAMHLRLRERVAIKVLKPEIAARAPAVARFMREARLSMKLHGEHVVRIFDVDVLGDSLPYFVMEQLEGEDLATHIAKEAPLPIAEIVDYMLQVCEGVAEAHALGIVHRDLKPANLFLTRKADGGALMKVLDFGVSKAAAAFFDTDADTAPSSDPHILAARPEVDDATLTSTRAMIGSPRYMSPEQVRSSRDVDARSDIWALGAILYEMACGSPPFAGTDLERLRADIVDRPHPPLDAAPARIRAIVDKCLAKDPADRYRNIATLADALADVGPESMRDHAARVRSILGMPARERSSRWWVVAMSVVGAGVVVAMFANRHTDLVVASAPQERVVAVARALSVAPSMQSAAPLPIESSATPIHRDAPVVRRVSKPTPSASAIASARPDPDTAFDRPE